MSKVVYPYIPNSVPEVKKQMLKELGLKSVEEIYAEIPEHLRFKGTMNLPEPLLSEYELRRHVEGILAQNKTCTEYLNFLGGGTWQHYVPEVCDTINSRDEFLTCLLYTSSPAGAQHGACLLYTSRFCFGLRFLPHAAAVHTPTTEAQANS